MIPVQLRPFHGDDSEALHAVFYSSVHGLAGDCYSAEQLAAWAPCEYDRAAWAERLTRNRPWVAERDGVIAGYADLQADGYIDQFFVAAEAAGRGVGTALMLRILEQAAAQRIPRLHSSVSLAAEGFFRRHGFLVEAVQRVTVRGVVMQNARMVREMRKG